jgi:hypothetical protein
MDRKTHVRFLGGCARVTAHGYPTKPTTKNISLKTHISAKAGTRTTLVRCLQPIQTGRC